MGTKVMNTINAFPGYECVFFDSDKKYHNIYRGTDVGKGGYIISNPGIYGNVALLDIVSLHPNSIRAMNCFGEYTKNFTDILDARVAIKHGEFDSAKKMLNGRLAPYLTDESMAKDLAQALKIAVNSVYGLTAANFDNPFRDVRNKNNIVALRGALFMRTLQDEVENKGYQIVAIKTDSIKIADADKAIIDFCMEFASQYGYTFEHEATYDKMCQINDADYIARYTDEDVCMRRYGYIPGDNKKHSGRWTSTGAQFSVPYVFKKLFSKEEILFQDLCETKEVKTALYLDMNENYPDVSDLEKEYDKLAKKYRDENGLYPIDIALELKDMEAEIAKGHNYKFVGKVGNFCPVLPGACGGWLVREGKDREGNLKYYTATGAKGHRWLEAEMVLINKDLREKIDYSYFNKLVDDAVEAIGEYGDVEWFISDETYEGSALQTLNECPF